MKVNDYRPDIDGLRAIAVLAVIGFHAFPGYFQGGFIGVDVFFVISGFLISNIILKDIAQNQFSFMDFYARRIKRIFPALILVLIACLLWGYFILMPHEFKNLGKHILSGSGFGANFTLYREAGYFDLEAELKPLLHLWSLGIEEQFYLIWPLLLFAAYQWKSLMIVFMISAGLLISFILNLNFVASEPDWTFYLPYTRFWELLMGSALSCFWVRLQGLNIKYLSWVGVGLIISAIFALDNRIQFPGWWALLPTLGAVFIIAAGRDAWINKQLLAHPILVFIGLISFPLYLWHWPLLSFASIIEGQMPSWEIRTVIVLISFILAILTYYLLEKPIRAKQKIIAVPLLFGMFVIGVCGYVVYSGKYQPLSANILSVNNVSLAVEDWGFPEKSPHLLLQGQHPETVLFMGDSNIQQYFPRIEKLLAQNDPKIKSAIFVTRGGCAPIPNVYEQTRSRCNDWTDKVLDLTKDPSITTVVIGGFWFGYLSGEKPNYYYQEQGKRYFLTPNSIGIDKAYLALSQMIQTLINNNKTVYLVINIPMGPQFDPLNRVQRDFYGHWVIDNAPVSKTVLEPYSSIVLRLREIAAQNQALILDPSEILCDHHQCIAFIDQDKPIYKDATHLRPFYVREHMTLFDEIMKGPSSVVIQRRD